MPDRRSPRTIRRAAATVFATALLLTACTATAETEEAVETPTPIPSATVSGPTDAAEPEPEPEPEATRSPAPSPPVATEDDTDGSGTAPVSGGTTADGATGNGADTAASPSPAQSSDDADADADPEQSKTHDDSVEVTSDIGGLSFTYGDYSGEDFSFDDAEWNSSSQVLTIDVEGTHDGSDSVADWFNDQTGGHAVHTDASSDSEPDTLHYAFCGTLTFSDFAGAGVETCFGQGDSGVKYNWWMGGSAYDDTRNGCYIDEDATDSNATSLVACIASEGTSSYTFELDAGGTHPNHLSFYSPSRLPALTGTHLTDFVDAHPDMSAGEKAVFHTLARKLDDDPVDVPTSWQISCGTDCTSSITSGQLWAGVHDTTTYDGVLWTHLLDGTNLNNYSINVTAGRNASDDVADWFVDAVGSGGMVGAGVNDGTTAPGKLNFAFCGDLTPQGGTATASMPLCIGQGSNFDDGESNNWWLGSSEWKAMEFDSATATDALELFVPVDELGLLPSMDVRMLVNVDRATALFVLSGNVVTGAAVDGAVFLVGLG
ncbi:hypothetical protein [Microbacterium aquimaris]|uniref:Lipoprotein n=1 Tax=Microbacterium aquimaris TaxID=459816 RepID=A0ABU5N7E6_9MICO|nr:hypothetical protein [Microbacterium aquimaris]MDZ8162028.1 hypothetical protein [Microbacterium aquimaris]